MTTVIDDITKKSLTACPSCGSDKYFTIFTFKGKAKNIYDFQGNLLDGDREDLYHLATVKETKVAACLGCKAILGDIKKDN